jgi:hypothetical protein
VRGHLRIDLSLVEGEAPSIAWRSVDAKGHALLDVCGIELTKPCTKEVVGQLMGSTGRCSQRERCLILFGGRSESDGEAIGGIGREARPQNAIPVRSITSNKSSYRNLFIAAGIRAFIQRYIAEKHARRRPVNLIEAFVFPVRLIPDHVANSQKQTSVQAQTMSALPQKWTSVGDR